VHNISDVSFLTVLALFRITYNAVAGGRNKKNVLFPSTQAYGIYIPVNKLELLAPYIGLTILLAVAVVAVGYVKRRKRNTENIS